MLKQLRIATLMLVAFTLLTGLAYPLAVTLAAQALFHDQANGSLITRGGGIAGSDLIGQPFDDPKYFWSRPSVTGPMAYNAAASSGSNLGVVNPAQIDAIAGRVDALRKADPDNHDPVPADLVTASGSGLDPHISIAAAEYQINRVARLRGLLVDKVRELVRENTQHRQLGLLGEPRVNVLRLNLSLDGWHPPSPHSWKDPM